MAELLAPAGDFERLRIAFKYGADAVYFGGKEFGLRANAQNFSLDEIKKATELAHSLNKKVYLTTNIVFHDKDFEGLDDYLTSLNDIGVDAIIISDPSVLLRVKKLGLNLTLFLSTQVSTLNHKAANFWKDQGIKRIVPGREAHRSDLMRIKSETGIELECFIHGAMCTSFSGRCVLSNYTTKRDSNRGGCAQICRWSFKTDSNEEIFSMTPKDLHMFPHIKDMIDIGIDSFKVEGRMRSIYYIATVIYVYRKLIDMCVNNKLNDAYIKYYLNILNRCANRESTPQFYEYLPKIEEQYFLGRKEISNQDFLGIVVGYDKHTKIATIEQRNYFEVGDKIEIFGPTTEETTFEVEKIWDKDNKLIDVARHPQMVIKLEVPVDVEVDDMIRKKVFDINDYL